jgi:hypothetical protein
MQRSASVLTGQPGGHTLGETDPDLKSGDGCSEPHSLSAEEQEVLFRELPDHQLRMAFNGT